MSDLRDRLEEYADGLLNERDRRELEAILHREPGLREELARVRRFDAVLETVHDSRSEERGVQCVLRAVERKAHPRGRLLRVFAGGAAAAAAAILLGFLLNRSGSTSSDGMESRWKDEVLRNAIAFGERLGTIAAERRGGRVPRTGLSDLETPPASASGIVFLAALPTLGVDVEDGIDERVGEMVAGHFVAMRKLGDTIDAECKRADASLRLFRELRLVAGAGVADAYYDLFRPGLADLGSAMRVESGSLALVVARQVDSEAGERYLEAYQETRRRLERRYGGDKLALVLERLAPVDRRTFRRDASQDGVGRDAVLAIRSEFYRAACDAGAQRLYVDLG